MPEKWFAKIWETGIKEHPLRVLVWEGTNIRDTCDYWTSVDAAVKWLKECYPDAHYRFVQQDSRHIKQLNEEYETAVLG